MVPSAVRAQLAPPTNGGIARFDWLLQQIGEPRRVLVIGAHPDDEDSGLLALLARGYGARAAYLSLSRGEGGQNLIGDELGVALGLLRTQELLAARTVDGAEQYFTRAYDFGYTRDLAETERFWTPDSILKDVVRVVRRFRPQVIVSVFSGTPRDGHGQHQMAGVMARRAFDVAGDPDAFPELRREEGLAPWTPTKLYTSTRFDREGTTLTLPEGHIDPRIGKSYSQIAMQGRSQHRSQDFGVLQRIGPAESRLALVRSRVPGVADTDILAGIPLGRTALGATADSLRHRVGPETLGAAVAPLARAIRQARALRARSGELTVDAEREVDLASEALALAAGVMIDARAARADLVPGEPVDVDVEVYHDSGATVALEGVTLAVSTRGWHDSVAVAAEPGVVAPGTLRTLRATLRPPRDVEPTQPYFLVSPLGGDLYDWSVAPPAVRGLPMQAPPLVARVRLAIDGVPVLLTREVTCRSQDQAVGEIREPIRLVPRIDVALEPDTIVWPADGAVEQRFVVTLRHNAQDSAAGTVALELDGWPAPPPQPFRLTRPGEALTSTFAVRRPAGVTRADVHVRAVVRTSDGGRFTRGVQRVTYSHIRPTGRVVPAEARVRVAPIALPAVDRIGYVRGASDRVPDALRHIGLPVELLDRETLASGDLSRFDVIVIGSRAYETDSALIRANDRLLAYVRAGGHLVVQYQQYPFVRGGYAPYALDIARPHDRITDETSPVTVLDPAQPVFQTPNRITSDDWDGWPQERGLYFAHTWDAAYRPMLEMRDPGQLPMRGGLLVARYGRGTYVYTGISFFRALPAGVPGAFRLFLNLLDLKGGDVP